MRNQTNFYDKYIALLEAHINKMQAELKAQAPELYHKN
jgi:hypothetical protein